MKFIKMNVYRGTKVYLTDVLIIMVSTICCVSIFIYSSLIEKTDLRVLELEGKMKIIEKLLEKQWIKEINKGHRR